MTQSSVDGLGTGLGTISVTKPDGRVIHYHSVPYVGRRDRTLRAHVREVLDGLLAQPGEHFVEYPNHPFPLRRKRRRVT
jgi:hypothetical protein